MHCLPTDIPKEGRTVGEKLAASVSIVRVSDVEMYVDFAICEKLV